MTKTEIAKILTSSTLWDGDRDPTTLAENSTKTQLQSALDELMCIEEIDYRDKARKELKT